MLKDNDIKEVFHSLASITVGRGNKVFFWRDRWIDGRSVLDIAPLVIQAVPTLIKNKRTVSDALLDHN